MNKYICNSFSSMIEDLERQRSWLTYSRSHSQLLVRRIKSEKTNQSLS